MVRCKNSIFNIFFLNFLGGGFAGATTAKLLEKTKYFQVTLVDSKDYFEYYPSVPMLIQTPSYAKSIRMEYDKILKSSTLITNNGVQEITGNQIF